MEHSPSTLRDNHLGAGLVELLPHVGVLQAHLGAGQAGRHERGHVHQTVGGRGRMEMMLLLLHVMAEMLVHGGLDRQHCGIRICWCGGDGGKILGVSFAGPVADGVRLTRKCSGCWLHSAYPAIAGSSAGDKSRGRSADVYPFDLPL